ncbi:hypothetical protein Tco_0901784 [Tanacetum coccineum]
MEEASLHTTRKTLITHYYDKHWVPPTKRLFKVAMLDPAPKFIVHGNVWRFGNYQLFLSSPSKVGASNEDHFTLKFAPSFRITPTVPYEKTWGYSEWATPRVLSLARRKSLIKSQKEEELDHRRPSKLCALNTTKPEMNAFHIQMLVRSARRWVFCKLYEGPEERSSSLYPRPRGKKTIFLAHGPFEEFLFKPRLIPQLVYLFVGDMRWRDDE